MAEPIKGKYHAEVKSHTNGTEVRINIFAESLGEVFQDIVCIQKQYTALAAGQIPPIIAGVLKAVEAAQAKTAQEVERQRQSDAEILAKATAEAQAKATKLLREAQTEQKPAQAKPVPKPEPEAEEIPVCQHCGSDANMELIDFQDKKTGEQRQAWKCQECKKWHFQKR